MQSLSRLKVASHVIFYSSQSFNLATDSSFYSDWSVHTSRHFKDVKFFVILLQSACQLVINEVDDDDDDKCII